MTSGSPRTPDETAEKIERAAKGPPASRAPSEEDVQHYHRVVALLRASLTPPPMVLATPEELLALVTPRTRPTRSLARVSGAWIALLCVAAMTAYSVNHLVSYSSLVVGLLRQIHGGLGLVAAAVALFAVVTSPAIIILGYPRLAERSIR